MSIAKAVAEYEAQGWRVTGSDPVLNRVTLARPTRKNRHPWWLTLCMALCTFGLSLIFVRGGKLDEYVTLDTAGNVIARGGESWSEPRLAAKDDPQRRARAAAKAAAAARNSREAHDEEWRKRREAGWH